MNVYPDANVVRGSGGQYVGGPFRGVLHSTEGDSVGGAIASFQSDGYWPHFTVTSEKGIFEVYQHLDPLTEAACALEHRPGTCQTNNQSAVQIECVGHAATSGSWPVFYLKGLAALMRWIEKTTGVHPISTVQWSATDVGDSIRLSESEWLAYAGWCGHQHVVNQEHWDPGGVNIAALLPKPVGVVVNGVHITCPAFFDSDTTWVGVRAVCAAMKLQFIAGGSNGRATVTFGGKPGVPQTMRIVGETGYVAAHDLPAHVAYDATQNLLQITTS